jgi:hypothetical protein
MRSRAALIVVLVGLSFGGTAAAQAGSDTLVQVPLEAGVPEVSAAVSPSVVHLGARFTLFVTVTFDPGVQVNLREPVDLGGAFEVRRRDSRDRDGGNGKRVREYQLEVVAWELGDVHVPPIAVTFTISGHAGQVATNAVPMRVDSMLGATAGGDPRPLGDAPPAQLTARDWFWLWVSGAAAVALVGLVLVVRWRGGRRAHAIRLPGGGAARRLDTPGQRALARLAEIERSGVLDRDATRKPGYGAMVEAIRDYIGARYRVVTRDLTTSELLRALARIAPRDEQLMLELWLERCDVVKYGGLRATAASARGVLGDARAVVIATTTSTPAAQSQQKAAA